MELINAYNGKIIAKKIDFAKTFSKRLKGLMFEKNLEKDCALYLSPCKSIHTFFMKFGIDVLYIDGDDCVVEMDEDLKPGRFGKYVKESMAVLELNAGEIKKSEIKIGNKIYLKE